MKNVVLYNEVYLNSLKLIYLIILSALFTNINSFYNNTNMFFIILLKIFKIMHIDYNLQHPKIIIIITKMSEMLPRIVC